MSNQAGVFQRTTNSSTGETYWEVKPAYRQALSYNRIWCLEEFEVWGVPC